MAGRATELIPFAQLLLDFALLGVVVYFLARDRASARRMREETSRLQDLAAALRRLRDEGEAAAGEIGKTVEERGAELRKLLKESERKRGELLGLFEAVESKRLAGVTAPTAGGGASADLYMRAAKLLLVGENEAQVADAMGITPRELRLIRDLQPPPAVEEKPRT